MYDLSAEFPGTVLFSRHASLREWNLIGFEIYLEKNHRTDLEPDWKYVNLG